jgi:hypothetical protein
VLGLRPWSYSLQWKLHPLFSGNRKPILTKAGLCNRNVHILMQDLKCVLVFSFISHYAVNM